MIPFAEKTDSICPTCYETLRGVERFKGSIEEFWGGGVKSRRERLKINSPGI